MAVDWSMDDGLLVGLKYRKESNMEKVEQYIKEHIKLYGNYGYIDVKTKGFTPWITLEEARSVAEIAREETIKEVCEWIEKNVYSYTWCEFQQHERGVETGKLIEDLKKHLEDEL